MNAELLLSLTPESAFSGTSFATRARTIVCTVQIRLPPMVVNEDRLREVARRRDRS
jgi:hypothetical protein